MEIPELYKIYEEYPAVTTDTRNCRPYSIFFALKGENFDGNTYIQQALDAGCVYAVSDNPDLNRNNPKIIHVTDTLETLQELARYHRKMLQIPVIMITGTNGKTTTKELVASVLSKKYNTLYTQGNLNNHIGVPLTLLQLTNGHEIAVIEAGANHPGEIAILAAIAEPDYGLITNVGKAHLEGFGSFENVIKTKSELYEFIDKTKGKIFINKDNPILDNVPFSSGKIYYGTTSDSFVFGQIIENKTPFLCFEWNFQEQKNEVKTKLIGNYNFENALAAVAIGCYFDMPATEICSALNDYQPQNNRSQFKETANNKLIIDAYNANPTSMLAALENFAAMNVFPKAVILGDMKELGKESESEHRKILDFIDKNQFGKIFLCGEIFSGLSEGKNFSFSDVNQLTDYLKNESLKDYYVLIKGSRGIKLEKTIAYL